VRAPGVRLDPGGIAKGMAADLAAAALPSGVRYAISCGGDVAVGGGEPWELAVRGARGDAEVHRLRVRAGGVATSGIAARIWRRADGSYARHLSGPLVARRLLRLRGGVLQHDDGRVEVVPGPTVVRLPHPAAA
jgi:FAD:protein FMN transferase